MKPTPVQKVTNPSVSSKIKDLQQNFAKGQNEKESATNGPRSKSDIKNSTQAPKAVSKIHGQAKTSSLPSKPSLVGKFEQRNKSDTKSPPVNGDGKVAKRRSVAMPEPPPSPPPKLTSEQTTSSKTLWRTTAPKHPTAEHTTTTTTTPKQPSSRHTTAPKTTSSGHTTAPKHLSSGHIGPPRKPFSAYQLPSKQPHCAKPTPPKQSSSVTPTPPKQHSITAADGKSVPQRTSTKFGMSTPPKLDKVEAKTTRDAKVDPVMPQRPRDIQTSPSPPKEGVESPSDTPDSSEVVATQTSNNAPPQLPSKANRPKLQRQSETMTCDDSVIENRSRDIPKSPPHSSLRHSRSMENLDLATIEGEALSIKHTSTPNVISESTAQDKKPNMLQALTQQVKLRKKLSLRHKKDVATTDDDDTDGSAKEQKTPKKRSSFNNAKPMLLLRKYLTVADSSDEKETKNQSDSSDSGLKSRSRLSIGDRLKNNIKEMFKDKKDNESETSPVSKARRPKGSSSGSATSPRIVTMFPPPLDDLATIGIRTSDSRYKSLHGQEQHSNAPGAAVLPAASLQDAHNSSSSDYEGSQDDDDVDDDDDDWDDTDFSDDEEPTCGVESTLPGCYENYTMPNKPDMAKKRKNIMEEIVETETSYVNKLYMLNKTLWAITGANYVHEMFQFVVIHQMFPSIEALYRLHGENILPALKFQLENWSTKPEMAALWKKYLPFLTMYKSYMSQYDWALETINAQKKASPEFAVCLARIEEKSEFGKLSLEHHLLEPIQRIARYKLLLQNYHKLLGPDDEEPQKLQEIIDSFDKLLNSCQSQLKKKDVFGDLCKLQEKFEDTLSMLTPTANLLKEGPSSQLTGNNNRKKSPKQLFLFTDCLLVCSKKPSGKFKIEHQMDLQDLKIRAAEAGSIKRFDTDKIFLLNDKEISVTMYFKELETKDAWEDAKLLCAR